MNVNYHVDYTLEEETNVKNPKEVLDCLNQCSRVWINGKQCEVITIDYTVSDHQIDVFLGLVNE